jgi:bud site selection protein 20
MGKKGRGVNQGRGHKTTKKELKAKNKRKHLDEIDADLKPKVAASLLHQEIDYDLPGKGQNYCLHCARYFITAQALLDHLKSKVHKRRLKQLEEEPYSVEESLRAAGIGSFVEPKKRLVQSQPTDEGEDYVPPAEVM